MGYKPSPRPVFDRPSHIPYAGVTRHLWGEENAGLVDDWIYASTESIHQIVFMQPGGCFKHTMASRDLRGVRGSLRAERYTWPCQPRDG